MNQFIVLSCLLVLGLVPVAFAQAMQIDAVPIDTASIEQELADLINQYRQEQGLNELNYNPNIANVARSHSLDQIENNYFSHYALDGRTSGDRGKLIGKTYCGSPESISALQRLAPMYADYQKKNQSYDSRITEYERRLAYYESIGSNNISLYNWLQKEYADLQRLGSQIDGDYTKINNAISKVNNDIRSGKITGGLSENLFYFEGPQDRVIQRALESWKNSEGHNSNMLNPNWHETGIGISVSNDKIIITQNFC